MKTISNRHPLMIQISVKNTKEMALKIMEAQIQEAKSNILRAKQDLEDIKLGVIKEAEYKILHAEAELKAILEHAKAVKDGKIVDATQVENK